MTVFVDTSALYALVDAQDPRHAVAAGMLRRLQDETGGLVSHEYVIVETIALVQRRLGLVAVASLVDDLLPLVEAEWVDPDLHRAAREALLAGGQRGISLVDWTSFLVMRRRGIETAFAFDDDFVAQGFRTLPD